MLNMIMDIGKSSLLSHQRAIAVTSHNIANVNTDGYSRQRAIFATRIPLDSRPGQLGTGVKIESIERIYDRFTLEQLNAANVELEKWKAMADPLRNIEAIFNEAPGFGINDALNRFFNAWHDLANNPTGLTERENLVACAQILADRIKNIMDRLASVKSDVAQALDLMLGGSAAGGSSTSGGNSINGLASEIAKLNEKIFKAEIGGNNANDLRDTRDLLVGELTAKLGATAYEDKKGNINIQLPNGMPIVEGFFSYDVSIGAGGEIFLNLGGSKVNITSSLKAGGGTIGGLLEVRDEIIVGYENKMNEFAKAIITAVNLIHGGNEYIVNKDGDIVFPGGWGLPRDQGDQYSFFTFSEENVASTMAINIELVKRPSLIAASSVKGDEGNNDIAIQIAMLQDKRFIDIDGYEVDPPPPAPPIPPLTPVEEASLEAQAFIDALKALKGSTFNDFFAALIGKVGADLNTINNRIQQCEDVVLNLENHIESISGVNLDEEMIDLIRFQHAYEAAAKLIAVTDELYVSLLSIK